MFQFFKNIDALHIKQFVKLDTKSAVVVLAKANEKMAEEEAIRCYSDNISGEECDKLG